jgi:hypothetical protein
MTTEQKTYSKASNAKRGAIAAGHKDGGFSVYKIADGKFGWRLTTPKPGPVKAAKTPKIAKAKATKKIYKLIDLITQGATITELTEALGWQKHTVRAAICRLSKAGYTVVRTKVGTAEDRFESHYKIAA